VETSRLLTIAFGLTMIGALAAETTPGDAAVRSPTWHSYETSSADLANPDRGFFHYTETHYRPDGSGYTPLDIAQLTGWREQQNVTLVYRIFYLEKFVGQDSIDSGYLQLVAADLAAARAAGIKLIVRFAYSDNSSADAPAARVVKHIRQLAPVLNASAGVISVLQAGFIGEWGEWYYTDNFASNPAQPWNLTDGDWAARGSVLNTLLNSTKASIVIQVRYPAIKQRLVVGTDPQSARVGIHDDCFLGGTDDYGTFATLADRQWLANQTLTVPLGGESCAVNAPRSGWPSARTELATYHWSFLNADYHPDVLSSWGVSGRAEAGQRLGYRLRLISSSLPANGRVGDILTIRLGLTNDGFAAPFRDRPVQLVMRGATKTYRYALPVDLRTLQPGATTTWPLQVPAPATPGSYALFLVLPDPSVTLSGRPAYNIQLANTGTWDAARGWNDLQQSISIVGARRSAQVAPAG